MTSATPRDVARGLGLEEPWLKLRQRVDRWVATSDRDLRPMLQQQFEGNSKYFRPLTVFACHCAVSTEPVPEAVLMAAQAIEMFHNVTLIVDDLVDGSRTRRGKLTLHAKHGPLTAWMVAGYIDACAIDLLASGMPAERNAAQDGAETWTRRHDEAHARGRMPKAKDRVGASILVQDQDPRPDWQRLAMAGPGRFDLRLLSELKRRLAVAECIQWNSRKGGAMAPGKKHATRLLGLADWRYLAREDTGSMFEICACLGSRSQRYRRLGRLLGMLYHGCDDVADVCSLRSLGGGGDEDIEEGILTLPAALAIQQSARIRALFSKPSRTQEDLQQIREALIAQLPRAARELDEIRDQASAEAEHLNVLNRRQMSFLVDYIRQLAPADESLAA